LEAHKILKTYLRRLTNLSGNSRSILLLRLANEQLIDLHKLSYLEKQNSFSIIKSLIATKPHTLCAIADARMEISNELSHKLKRLARIDDLIFEEKGSRDLHVGWPMMRGKFNDGTLLRAPLLYFPVKLMQLKDKWVLELRKEVDLVFNKSFLLAYAYYNQIEVDDNLLDRSFEDFDTDPDIFRSSLYEVLKESKIEIDFNADNFRDELQFFEEFTKPDFEEKMANGRIKLFPEAVLGIFPQAATQLVPDYNTLIESEEVKDLEAFFYERSPARQEASNNGFDMADIQQSVKEEKLFNAFALDAHQELAIKAIKAGNSLVVQGPPGTGKSQLICNLMSDAMANGKRVLVVCQKRAALDVVFERMKEKNLSDFLGLVHDYRNDRKSTYQKIQLQIERLDEYKQRNNSLDIIQLERNYIQTCRRIDQITEELEEFRQALYDESACGFSPKEMYLNSSPHSPAINLRQEFRFFNQNNSADFIQKLKSYHAYATNFLKPDYLLNDRKSFAGWRISDLKKIIKTINEIVKFQIEKSSKIKSIFNVELSLQEAEEILKQRNHAVEMLGALRLDTIFHYFSLMKRYESNETSMLWLSNLERVFMVCYTNEGPEITLPVAQLGKFQLALKRGMDARKSLIKLIRWELFSDDKFLIKRVLVSNQIKPNKSAFKLLVKKIDNRLNLEHNITKLRSAKWLSDFPEGYDKSIWQQWFQKQKMALRAKIIYDHFNSLNITLSLDKTDAKIFKDNFEKLFELLQDIPERKASWEVYLTTRQINRILRQPETAEVIINQLNNDFDALCESDKIYESLADHEKSTIEKLYSLAGIDASLKELNELFENSFCLSWLDYLESKYPVLRSVSSLRLSQLENELQELIQQKQDISTDIVLMRAREKIYDEVEFNRLRNRVTYRDLHHQVTKKKRIWPIRKLITEFNEELFKLLPCWLASPETVSAIFPMQNYFDLVIFDEASQCFAERGIPAMYRGRQILIAGDEKQLRPFDLYQLRWDDAGAEDPDLEVDSLLDLAARYLLHVQLKGHYRSKSPELIQFSNSHFYGNTLQMIPDRLVMESGNKAISFEKVEGVWEHNTNRMEAEKIVELIAEIHHHTPEKSIGVISFNAPQQMLIMDLLENHFSLNQKSWPEKLIVKNIENVQGDEKDIIIFSLAYAPGKKGKMTMQFGSLNVAGGENRLNVAVTRAREKVIVVSSILPHQLNVNDAKNEGPRLLREYLQYAFDIANDKLPEQALQVKQHAASWYLSSKILKEINGKHENLEFTTTLLPSADIEVREHNRYKGVLLTDDEHYHAALSAKENHAYLPLSLNAKNWPNQRLYSREWWLDNEKVLNKVQAFVTKD
jgi:superfamily I DNA and/or RNA helicase